MPENLIRLKERRLHIPGLRKTYCFLHVTDAHVLLYDETETPRRAAYAEPRTRAFAADGIPTWRRFDALCDYAEGHRSLLDGVLFTGDIIDFPSAPNLAYLQKHLEKLRIPYIFLLGNHDWAYFDDYQTPHAARVNRPLFSEWCGGDTYVQKKRFGELTFLGVDNTMELYEDRTVPVLASAMEGEQNVLLLQHIPFYASTLHDDTVAYWHGRDINIGGAGICKNENWKSVRAMVTASDSPVRAVITGHLHFWHEDLLEGGIPQFVTANAADGSACLFTISG